MDNLKPWINGPYNPENSRDTVILQNEIPQRQQKETNKKDKVRQQQEPNINIPNKEAWNTGPFYNKSTKCYKQESDFKFANLEGTPFFRDYRIKK
jgi:hypothetical protein